ncbi:MAG TPA: cobalamin-binding protein [Lutibacter sp.]|nr:cobalamin-binding protein [Lutibacter sp.]
MIFKDALNRKIELPKTPQRIISLVPSLTELLHDIGLEKNIVGITKYCVHPSHYLLTKKRVGGTKKVKFQDVKDLKPDFILCSKEENTPEMVSELEKIAPVYVSDVNSLEDALQLIRELGVLFDRRTQTEHIIDKINFQLKEFENSVKDISPRKAAYFIWANPWMVAGSKTFIDDMLRICKFENAYAAQERYPKININTIKIKSKATLLLFSSEPYDFSDDEVFEVLRKNRKTMTIYVDGQFFSWYGSRLIKAFDHFKDIHKRIAEF